MSTPAWELGCLYCVLGTRVTQGQYNIGVRQWIWTIFVLMNVTNLNYLYIHFIPYCVDMKDLIKNKEFIQKNGATMRHYYCVLIMQSPCRCNCFKLKLPIDTVSQSRINRGAIKGNVQDCLEDLFSIFFNCCSPLEIEKWIMCLCYVTNRS